MELSISVSEELRTACPDFVGGALSCSVVNSEFSAELWREIDRFIDNYRSVYTIDSVKSMPSIEATRQAYKRCGKDPSRYRPSSEALIRRTLKGMDLYKVDTLVDLVNLASIESGYSIGGFDRDKIEGTSLVLGVGRKDEPYEGIGRGPLNIEGLPVYRDSVGGIGTPTSDNERTKMSVDTIHFLGIVNGYDGDKAHVEHTLLYMRELIEKYCQGTEFEMTFF